MEVLRFTLSGKHAFFKKPEVNTYCYYTYGNIHKVALLGIFGAILGYGGYSQMKGLGRGKKKKELSVSYPEFYEKLRELKISILPARKFGKGYIPKKVQTFNNSVGYASKEQGGNLIVREQWLENPQWEICLLIDSAEAQKMKAALCNRTCVFYPYLGKNDHPADISEVKIEQADKSRLELGRLDCFFLKDEIAIADLDEEEQEELDAFCGFKYEEALPYGMDGWTNQYQLKTWIYTDAFVNAGGTEVYQLEDEKKIVFY